MRIGVYVGSFDPVHKGHIKMIKQLLNRRMITKVVLVATGSYWHKSLNASINDRIKMLKTYQSKRIIIDDKNNNLPYTYMVLNALQKEYPNDQLCLIIGDDLAVDLVKWQNLDELLKFSIIVINRFDLDISKQLDLLPKPNNIYVIKDMQIEEISSSYVRQLIDDGKLDHLSKYLDQNIINYIIDHKLYQV